jgi:hypothetical protein
MQYDIALIEQLCREIGLPTRIQTDTSIEIDLGEGAALFFENSPNEEDSAIGFSDTPWHTHGETLMFVAAHGHYIECDYLDLVVGLQEGRILVGERIVNGQILDRWLVHHVYNDELKYLDPGEKIIVRRVIASGREVPSVP